MNPSQRTYDASDLKVLFSKTGEWARNWDDVLRYLESPAATRDIFSAQEVPQLVEDVRHLKQDHVHFTTDYREIWQELHGNGSARRDADAADEAHAEHGASSRVLDVLQRVQSREYREMANELNRSRTTR